MARKDPLEWILGCGQQGGWAQSGEGGGAGGEGGGGGGAGGEDGGAGGVGGEGGEEQPDTDLELG